MRVFRDLRYSSRALRRTPGATLALLLSAGIAIGANAVVFGFLGHLVDPAAVMAAGASDVSERLDTIRVLLVMTATFVFVIATATMAGLLLSRGAARVHETAVRVTLGADGRDLYRPLLAEGLLIGCGAIVVGLVAALWTSYGLPAMFYQEDVESLPFSVDWRGLAVAIAAGALLSALGALAPLGWMSRERPATDSRGSGSGLANRFGGWRSTLVASQLTLCAVLLISTGAVLDHLEAALRTDHAERTGQTLVVRMERVGSLALFETVIRETFGDVDIGVTHVLPAGLMAQMAYRAEPALAEGQSLMLGANIIGGSHLDLEGVDLVLGRSFDGRDTIRSRRVILVNEQAAQLLGDDVPLLGRQLVDEDGNRAEVIGMVRDAPFRTLQPRPLPAVYFAHAQRYPSTVSLVIRVPRPVPQEQRSALNEALDALRRGRVTSLTSMQEHLTLTSTAADRLVIAVVRVLVALSVLLSLIGVTGMTSDAVARRRSEIALRMALGAPRWRIVTVVVASAARLGLHGALAGVLICLVAFRFVPPMLDGSRGPALWVWAGAVVVLMAVVTLGAIFPARRAATVDPALLLRE